MGSITFTSTSWMATTFPISLWDRISAAAWLNTPAFLWTSILFSLSAAAAPVLRIAVDPSMTIDAVRPLLPYVELVCVMTVNPGYAGQKLIPQMIDKIKELAGTLTEEPLEIEIEVDGNVSWQNIPRMGEAGAQILVAGSSSLFEAASELEVISSACTS